MSTSRLFRHGNPTQNSSTPSFALKLYNGLLVVVFDISPLSALIVCSFIHIAECFQTSRVSRTYELRTHRFTTACNMQGRITLFCHKTNTFSAVRTPYAPDRGGAYSTLPSRYKGSSIRSLLNAPRGRDQLLHPLLQIQRQLFYFFTQYPQTVKVNPSFSSTPSSHTRQIVKSYHIHPPNPLSSRKLPLSAHLSSSSFPFINMYHIIHSQFISTQMHLFHLFQFINLNAYIVLFTSFPPMILFYIPLSIRHNHCPSIRHLPLPHTLPLSHPPTCPRTIHPIYLSVSRAKSPPVRLLRKRGANAISCKDIV